MSEQSDADLEAIPTEETPDLSPPKADPLHLLRRLGCLILLIFWFALLLTPCLVVYLATQGELVIPLGGSPNQVLRLWVVMNAEQRGIGVSNATVYQQDGQPEALCVQTDVRFIFWAGEGESATFCECYQRSSSDTEWSATSVQQRACIP